MRDAMKWLVLGLVSVAVFVLTFLKTPESIASMLQGVAADARTYSAIVHALFVVVAAVGLFFKRSRSVLFASFIAFLSLSATAVAVRYVIAPNVILFGVFFALILHAYFTKQLTFTLESVAPVDLLFGLVGLVFGFWYLHWVDSPVWANALLYSPLGSANCPTMLTVAGFLCLSQRPRSDLLEAFVGLMTLYFGFFGIFRLGAYVDVALVVCGLYLIVRLASRLSYSGAFGEEMRTIAPKPR